MQEMEVRWDARGKPEMALRGHAAKMAGAATALLSISHTDELAIAQVLIEKGDG